MGCWVKFLMAEASRSIHLLFRRCSLSRPQTRRRGARIGEQARNKIWADSIRGISSLLVYCSCRFAMSDAARLLCALCHVICAMGGPVWPLEISCITAARSSRDLVGHLPFG